jgi:hypothetical protein
VEEVVEKDDSCTKEPIRDGVRTTASRSLNGNASCSFRYACTHA